MRSSHVLGFTVAAVAALTLPALPIARAQTPGQPGVTAGPTSTSGWALPPGYSTSPTSEGPPAMPPAPPPYPQAAPQGVPSSFAEYGDPSQGYDPSLPGPDGLYANAYDEGDEYVEDIDYEAWTDYQDALSPYGTWNDIDGYGEVWSPSASVVGGDFSPYSTGGDWTDTEYGMTWVSDWSWGWAPFHYGRWATFPGYGWCWIRGVTGGPAWVSWRVGGGYVGWSPLGPRGSHVGLGMPRYGSPTGWRFVVAGQLFSRRPSYLAASVIGNVWGQTRTLDNWRGTGGGVRYNAGPPLRSLSPVLARTIAPTPLRSLPAAQPHVVASASSRALAPQSGVHANVTVLGPRPLGNAPSGVGPHALALAPSHMSLSGQSNARPLGAAPHALTAAPQRSVSNYYAPRYGYAPTPHYNVYVPRNNPGGGYGGWSGNGGSSYGNAPHELGGGSPALSSPQHFGALAPSYSQPSYTQPAYTPHYTAPTVSAPSSSSHFGGVSASHFSGGGGGGGGHHR